MSTVSSLQYAAFVDIMGFAHGHDLLADDDAQNLAICMAGDWTRHPKLSDPAKVLFVRYSRFHELFDDLVSKTSALTISVSFSDSGFVAANDRDAVINFARNMMCGCYEARVPTRIGIGYGTVGHATFSISLRPDLLSAQSQIFGTAIVRAYHASESKNAKGFRVLLHPSAQSEWDERLGEWEYPQLPADEQSKDSVRELNFLRVGDGGNHWDHCRGAVDEMRKWFSNERAECHYDGTVRTLDRFERERRTRFAEADAEGPIYILRHKLGDVKET
jgi:hypothetical protein